MPDPVPSVEIAVTIIGNENGEVLFDYSEAEGAFTLPTAEIEGESGLPGSEPAAEAALRAAVAVLGRPLAAGHRPQPVGVAVEPWRQRGRDGGWRQYGVRVFALRAPVGSPCPLPGHVAVWLPRHSLVDFAPVSPAVIPVLDAVPITVWATLLGG